MAGTARLQEPLRRSGHRLQLALAGLAIVLAGCGSPSPSPGSTSPSASPPGPTVALSPSPSSSPSTSSTEHDAEESGPGWFLNVRPEGGSLVAVLIAPDGTSSSMPIAADVADARPRLWSGSTLTFWDPDDRGTELTGDSPGTLITVDLDTGAEISRDPYVGIPPNGHLADGVTYADQGCCAESMLRLTYPDGSTRTGITTGAGQWAPMADLGGLVTLVAADPTSGATTYTVVTQDLDLTEIARIDLDTELVFPRVYGWSSDRTLVVGDEEAGLLEVDVDTGHATGFTPVDPDGYPHLEGVYGTTPLFGWRADDSGSLVLARASGEEAARFDDPETYFGAAGVSGDRMLVTGQSKALDEHGRATYRTSMVDLATGEATLVDVDTETPEDYPGFLTQPTP
ncbi:hypothetical protein [Demequina rhizosphaerae]|uniref:hypothetical protein n=1 Tax=Demequina rhizosphaerae TaxID=1638985 RepID=UPI0007834397|nr:hypothetical protein [Demequina rhizosphaerae]